MNQIESTINPTSATPVGWTANNYAIAINGAPFFVQGVCYSPVPWGGNSNWPPFGDFFAPPWSEIWERDLPLMRGLNINTVRTYNITDATGPHSEFFTAC